MSVKKGGQIIAGTPRTTGGIEIGDIGIAPFGIDESLNLRRYLNGQVISQSQFQSFTDKIKKAIELYPNLSATEQNWQAEVTASVLGQCGKFVIDDTSGTIRLPKVVNINGLQDLALIGGIKAESLPNIKGSFRGGNHISGTNESGAFYDQGARGDSKSYSASEGREFMEIAFGFDASRSSSTYQDGAKVQQEAVQYTYFIQVATGTEERLPAISEYKLNNPYFFGMSIWSEVSPNNASWLLSNGAFHSGYTDYYNWLLKIYNKTETVEGVSVKSVSDEYTDYDFVINIADTTFRLPLISGRVLVAKKEATTEDPSWFNWYSDGWLEQGGYVSFSSGATQTINLRITYADTNYTILDGYAWTSFTEKSGHIIKGTKTTNSFQLVAYDTLPESNWFTCGYAEVPTQSDYTELKGLYFYVGDTLQDPALINAGRVLNDIAELKSADFNQTSKEKIISWGMPDYSAGVSVARLPYTAPSKGVFRFTPPDVTSFHYIMINGITVFENNDYAAGNNQQSAYLSVDINDVISSNATPFEMYFYPFKGVI